MTEKIAFFDDKDIDDMNYCPFSLKAKFTYNELKILDNLYYTITKDYQEGKEDTLGVPSGVMGGGISFPAIGVDGDGRMKAGRDKFRKVVLALLDAWGYTVVHARHDVFKGWMEQYK